MPKQSFDHVDKDFDSLKKIKPRISLTEDDFRLLQADAQKFAQANQEKYKPTPRLYSKTVWKNITSEFVENDDLGEKYWNNQRKDFDEEEDLTWPEDKDDILFLAFCVLKWAIRSILISNKRKSGGDDEAEEAGTPKKKARTPKTGDTGDADDETPEAEEEDATSAEAKKPGDGAEVQKEAGAATTGSPETEAASPAATPATKQATPKKKPGRPANPDKAKPAKTKKQLKEEQQAEAMIKRSEEFAKKTLGHMDEQAEDEVDDYIEDEAVDRENSAEIDEANDEDVVTKTTNKKQQQPAKTPDVPADQPEIVPEEVQEAESKPSAVMSLLKNGRTDPYMRDLTPPSEYQHSVAVARTIDFQVFAVGHEAKPIFVTCESSVTFPHIFFEAQQSVSGAHRFALVECTKCKVVIPGGAMVEFDFRGGNAVMQAKWSGAMTMAEAAVGGGNLFSGQRVVLELDKEEERE